MSNKAIINLTSLIFLISLFLFTPFYDYKKIVIVGGTMVLWIFTSIALNKKAMRNTIPLFIILTLLMLIEYLYCVSTGNTYQFRRFFTQYLLTYMWGILGVFYASNIDLFKKSILYVVVIISISCIYTIVGNITFPGASRLLAGSEVEGSHTYNVLKSMNVGGYDFIYAVVFAVFPCVLWIKNRLGFRFISILFLIILLGTLLVGSYFTSIVLAIVALIITLSSARKLPKFLFVFGIMTLIAITFKDFILQSLVDFGAYIDSPTLQIRAQEMMEGSYQDEYDMSGELSRIDRMYNAFYNISQSPIWGRMFGTPIDVKISGHSELLGYFERYGLFGFIHLYFYYLTYKNIIRYVESKEMRAIMLMFIAVFFVFLALNTFDIANATGCMVLLIAPCAILAIEKVIHNNRVITKQCY